MRPSRLTGPIFVERTAMSTEETTVRETQPVGTRAVVRFADYERQ
jgi:hypothetical protein